MTNSFQEKTSALRRQHILDAATNVFSERGFTRASIRDIATAAGVADGTIYNVFENKDALLMSLLDALATPSSEPIVSLELLSEDPETVLKAMLEQRWKTFTPRTLAILRVALSQALIDPIIRKKLFRIFIEPALSGLAPLMGPVFDNRQDTFNRKKTTPRLVVASLIGLNVLAMLEDENTEASHMAMLDPLVAMLWQGLGKQGGLAGEQ